MNVINHELSEQDTPQGDPSAAPAVKRSTFFVHRARCACGYEENFRFQVEPQFAQANVTRTLPFSECPKCRKLSELAEQGSAKAKAALAKLGVQLS